MPIIWHQMANRKRDGEPLVTLMQTQVDIESTQFGKLAMTISVPHELSLKNFKLGGNENNSKIDSGILPFMVTPLGATSDEAAAHQDKEDDAILGYGVLYEGTNGLKLAEAREIRKSHVYFPLNWDEGRDQLWAFLAAFSSLHGCNHYVTIEFYAALQSLI